MQTIKKFSACVTITACMIALGGCGGDDTTAEPAGPATGAVYAMTNAMGENQIIVYRRAADGTLTRAGAVPTGGSGSGVQLDPTDSLGSQGGLILNGDHSLLFAVNTETAAADHDCNQGSISVFKVAADGALSPVGAPVPSGGLFPDSLTVSGDTLYVLNAGGPDLCTGTEGFEVNPNITGFRVGEGGELARIPGATQLINPGLGPGADACAPADFGDPQFDCGLNPPAFPRSPGQVGFTPKGDALVVTVKGTNSIYVFSVGADGVAAYPTITRAPDMTLPTYFGFDFDANGHLVVAEPFGTATSIPMGGTSAASSFRRKADGSLEAITRTEANGQGASCWIALDPRTRSVAYTTNNATNNISVFDIDADGNLTHRAGAEQALSSDGELQAHPNDMATVLAEDGAGQAQGYLYSLSSGTGRVAMFRIEDDGGLVSLGEVDGVPADDGAQGLAAF